MGHSPAWNPSVQGLPQPGPCSCSPACSPLLPIRDPAFELRGLPASRWVFHRVCVLLTPTSEPCIDGTSPTSPTLCLLRFFTSFKAVPWASPFSRT